MKKGLRLGGQSHIKGGNRRERFPDEEGIKTGAASRDWCAWSSARRERFPDEEGIKTLFVLDRADLVRRERFPDEEGIKTRRFPIASTHDRSSREIP